MSDPRTLRSGTVTCRRSHACDGCPRGQSVAPGERMHVLVAIVDGRFEARRFCVDGGAGCWPDPVESPARTLGEHELAF